MITHVTLVEKKKIGGGGGGGAGPPIYLQLKEDGRLVALKS